MSQIDRIKGVEKMEIVLSISFGVLYVITGIIYFLFTNNRKSDK